MDKKLQACLSNCHDSFQFPFLWLHGDESHERILEEIIAIKNCGFRAFCVESRPYEAFCEEPWWRDMGFILRKARELDMKVWLLDDKHFPTGYASGFFEKEENAHLRKKLIREVQAEAVGPMRACKVDVEGWIDPKRERVLSVIAYPHIEGGERLDAQGAIDLTDTLRDGTVYFDLPRGVYRICTLIETDGKGDSASVSSYIDMLSRESCEAMLKAVYLPHYEHFSEYFGNTFAGFFSDEPGFLNCVHTYHNTLGLMGEKYPWSAALPSLIAESAGASEEKVRLLLPALWEDLGDESALLRMHYMEVVSRLYSENFGFLLGDFCRAHGVMYIGHVIEDQNAHMRLGYGSGHYFRALDGQDMAGIDIVLTQDIPGLGNRVHRGPVCEGGRLDGSFFRYTLPKLAASHAHIDPKKKGRAMCEIFGAFGWAEGLPYMKALADTMICSGVYYFVPHAFSVRAEDPDCPPHFYNGGKYIHYPLFSRLVGYMDRFSHLMSDSVHRADVAVFYNAEGEWTGGKNQPFSDLCAVLTQGTVDFDIIPYDMLCDARVENGRLRVGKESYGALIISESEIMPYDRLSLFARLRDAGLPILFTESLPRASAEGRDISALLSRFETAKTEALAHTLREKGLAALSGEGLTHLRTYFAEREGVRLLVLLNEAVTEDLSLSLALPEADGECLLYEPWDNRLYRSEVKDGKLTLTLEKGNVLIAIFGEKIPEGTPHFTEETAREVLALTYDIALKAEGEEEFADYLSASALVDITAPDRLPHFSGSVRYRTRFTAKEGYTVLDLGEVGETAEVWLNGVYLGVRVNAPYKFSMKGALKQGENELAVVTVSNAAHRRRDELSRRIFMPPTGILGELALCKYEKSK